MEKKVYMSNQLCGMLPPTACKLMIWILGWQNAEAIKYYETQWSKVLHMSVDEIEIALQLLIDKNLIEISDNTVTIKKDYVAKYVEVPLKRVQETKAFELPSVATWKHSKQSKTDIEDMSAEDIKRMILRLQASLNEKEQVKKIVTNNADEDDLPW